MAGAAGANEDGNKPGEKSAALKLLSEARAVYEKLRHESGGAR